MINFENKELVVVLGTTSLYVGSNTKRRVFWGLRHFREQLKDKYPQFSANFWQKKPSPLWSTQTRIAGLALSAPSILENLDEEEVYFPTIDALVEVIKKVHQVKFILYATPFKSKEFSAYWNDTETLALVLARYLELKHGVTGVTSETIFVSDINNESEVSGELDRILSNKPISSIFNVQDAPPALIHAVTKRQQESEFIWLKDYNHGELGWDIPIYPV